MSLTACKNMDSVFDDCTNDELDFDVIFDEDDELIDSVCGVKENGDPLTGVDFEDLHNTDDEAKPDDLRDTLGPDNDNLQGTKKSDIEGAEKKEFCDAQEIDNLEKNGKADIDNLLDGNEDDYAEGKADGKVVDSDTVTGVIKKDPDIATESDDFSLDNAIDPLGYPSDDGSDKNKPINSEDNGDDANGKVEDADPTADAEVEGEDKYQSTDDASVKEEVDIDAALDETGSGDDPELADDADEPEADSTADECGGGIPNGVKIKEGTDIDDTLDDQDVESVEDDDVEASTDLSYDSSDEDIIDMVMGECDK